PGGDRAGRGRQVRPLHLPARRRAARPRRRRGAAHHGARAGRRWRAHGRGGTDPGRAGRDRRGAADGPAGRPAAGVRRRADAVLEADHPLRAGPRHAGPALPARDGARARVHPRRAPGRGDGRRRARRARPALRARGERLSTSGTAGVPYTDSRRLTGPNLYFGGTGAALETAPGLAPDAGVLQRWRDNVARARGALGWPDGAIVARTHATGASLAFAAPPAGRHPPPAPTEWP